MEPERIRLLEEDYLARERTAARRSEYIQGHAVAMAGGSPRHNAIGANLIRVLGAALREGPCIVLTSDQRVAVEATALYTYPDLTIACDGVETHPRDASTIINPTVIVEVLSASTEAYDRGAKFAHYRRIASLKEYVLVSQAHRRVEHHRRLEDGTWILTESSGDEGELAFPALGITVPIAEIYAKTEGLAGDPERLENG